MTFRSLSISPRGGAPIPRTVKILAALVPISAAAAGVARATVHTVNGFETKAHADSTFVRKDTFAIHQAGESKQHLADSLIIDARTARIDTALAALLRACRHEGQCP